MKLRTAVLGGGSWATAIAKLLVDKTHEIGWYMRKPEQIEEMQRTGHNPSYLQAVEFNVNEIEFSSDINHIIREYDALIFVTPSPYFKEHMKKVTEDLSRKYIIIATKGIVPDEQMVMSEYFHEKYNVPREQIVCLIGPSHAEEVAMNRLTYLTVACSNDTLAQALAKDIESPKLIANTSNDVLGIQYASTLKNIYAIGAGICKGLRYGDNYQAVFMANAVREMADVLNLLSPNKQRCIGDSVYLGDLLVTGYSNFSRNRVFGTLIGRGYSIKAAQAEMEMIAEGFYGAKCMHEIFKKYPNHHFPIVETIYDILYNSAQAKRTIRELNKSLR